MFFLKINFKNNPQTKTKGNRWFVITADKDKQAQTDIWCVQWNSDYCLSKTSKSVIVAVAQKAGN